MRELGKDGQELYKAIQAETSAADLELDGREEALLLRACATADDIAALEAVVVAEGPVSTGSTGQRIVHPALVEIRHQRVTLLRLLGALDLPEQQEQTMGQKRAAHAAQARYQRGRSVQLRRAQ